jgi:hypothetical protein
LKVPEGYTDPVTRSREVTGLPSFDGSGEDAYSPDGKQAYGTDPYGMDPESIALDPRDGSYWLGEEYGPSIVHVAADGTLLMRITPKGLGLNMPGVSVRELLPEAFKLRKANRGFEGLAISADGRTLYTSVQSPLSNPTKAAGEASRTIRFLTVSTRTGRPTGEYVYRMQPVAEYEPDGAQDAMKISGLVALGRDRLLVDERTDKVAKLYVADFRRASNVLGSSWDLASTAPSLESLASLPSSVRAARKSLLLDLSTVPGIPGKIEGIAVRGSRTVTVVSDNDFGMSDGPAAFDASGRLVDSGVETVLATITLRRSWE